MYLPSQLEHKTATLYVMVNILKCGGRAPPTSTSLGKFFHHDGMYPIKRPLPLCVYSVNKIPISYTCTHCTYSILYVSSMFAQQRLEIILLYVTAKYKYYLFHSSIGYNSLTSYPQLISLPQASQLSAH